MEFQRGKTKFIYGINDPQQLNDVWGSLEKAPIGIAFVGRSNVGKSSLINTLFGKGVAKTSKTPGRTRQINIFKIYIDQDNNPERFFYLFDLPGYGFAEIGHSMKKNWNELMTNFFQLCDERVLILNLQDARHPHANADQDFQDFFKPIGLDTFLVFNKMDKLKKQSERAKLKNLRPQIFDEYKWVKQIHFVSAEKRTGTNELENALASFLMNQDS